MAHAEKCPVCEGRGMALKSITLVPSGTGRELAKDFVITPTPSDCRVIEVPGTGPCRGCGGKGWVVVPDKEDSYETFGTVDELIQDLHEATPAVTVPDEVTE